MTYYRWDEVALSNCEFGCKVMRCRRCHCLVVYHVVTYGHRETSVQESSTGARCTCT